jgi:mono/diheme cytochrome c family protein
MKNFVIATATLLVAVSASAAGLNGKALYQQNCASCHGDNGKGGTQEVKGPKLAGDASKWSLKLFERAVLSGIDDKDRKLELAMPHWKDASFKSDKGDAPSKQKVAAIHRYLRTVK